MEPNLSPHYHRTVEVVSFKGSPLSTWILLNFNTRTTGYSAYNHEARCSGVIERTCVYANADPRYRVRSAYTGARHAHQTHDWTSRHGICYLAGSGDYLRRAGTPLSEKVAKFGTE